jgi:hypothetical protein
MVPTETPPPPDNFWGEPSLPDGDTGLPPANAFNAEYSKPLVIHSQVDNVPTEPQYDVSLLTDDILGQFNTDQRIVIRAFFPLAWGKSSPYLGGTVVSNFAHLLQHAEAYSQDQLKAQRQADTALREADRIKRKAEKELEAASRALQADRWLAWQNDCRLRKEWIDDKKRVWKERVEQAKAARAQWDAFVQEARAEYIAARDTTAPPQPV